MKRPVLWFCVIAYAFSWTFTVLVKVSLTFGFVALFGPALAAYIVARAADGPAGLSELRGRFRIWRVGIVWYAVALLLPELLSGVAALTGVALGAPADIGHLPIDGIKLMLFVTVAGEEIGWRGWLLPRLLQRWPPLTASLIVGVIWAGWHLPTFLLPGTTQSHFPLPAYFIYVCALSVLFTWLYFKTQGSSFYATVLHGGVNTFLIWNFAAGSVQRDWLTTLVYSAAALVVVLVSGTHLGATQPTR